MRAVGMAMVLAAGALGCVSEVPVRVVYVPIPEPCIGPRSHDEALVALIQRDTEDASWSAYHSERPPSIDLGYIGDAPVGRYPTPPHRLPEWEKPFRLGGQWSSGWGLHGVRR
jgi:hypothetical protein